MSRNLILAAAVAVVGLTASIVWAAVGLADQARRPADMVTTTTPGAVSVQITRPGTHVVYLESVVPAASRDSAPSLTLTATDITVTAPDGTSVPTHGYSLDVRYDSPRGSDVVGQAFAAFDADEPGVYGVATDVSLSDPTARIAVGDDLAPGVLRAIGLPLLTGVFSLVAAIVLAVRAVAQVARRSSTSTERSA